MRFIFAAVFAGLITGFVIGFESLPFCTSWCAVPAVMLNAPGTLVRFFVPALPLAVGFAATFAAWFLIFWLIFSGSRRHHHHPHERIPRRHRRHRY